MNIAPDCSLVLIGGGHSHAIALKQWGLNPLADVNLILISDVENTPYSGMLPGHVAGFYSYVETHINLQDLAQFAGANLITSRATGLDLERNLVICEDNSVVRFDYLSIDIGSTPQTSTVSGAKEYAIPAKPVPIFLAGWSKLLTEMKRNAGQLYSLAIVGGGAGGVELAVNMQSRLQRESIEKTTIHLIHRGDKLLSGHNNWVSNKVEKILSDRGIKLHLQQNVCEVLPHKVICESDLTIDCDRVFWLTQASSPSWIAQSPLTTDDDGFILVKDTLQSVSHPHIFAAGDIATMENYQRPKAGVFAVRQGKPLLENWRRMISNQPLQSYTPQKKYLALIGTGDRNAIASWGGWGWRSPLLWYLKDYIDRKFMKQFDLQKK
ncbi:MAG: FAD-dependent oxidoreductase [Pleurocapsa sp.]